MPDPTIVARLVADGFEPDAAATAVTRVFAAVRANLDDGRRVRIDDVGQLSAPMKRVFVPGSNKKKAREQRRVELSHPAMIEKGEPYDTYRWEK